MQGIPLKIQELLKLQNVGIQNTYYKLGVLCLESDRFLTVRDVGQDGKGQLTMVDLQNNCSVNRRKNDCEAFLNHPTQNIIAFKAKDVNNPNSVIIQIWNLDKKEKLKSFEMTEEIKFWKWISNTQLGIIGITSVYHVNLSSTDNQTKVFDRSGSMTNAGIQILGYQMDKSGKWSTLFGISSPDGGKTIDGSIQLCLLEGQKQQLLEGYCACFGEAIVHDDSYVSSLFSFVEKKSGETVTTVHFTEIGAPKEGFQKFKRKIELPLSTEFANDLPVYMHIANKHGLLYIVTRFGFLYIYEISTPALILKHRISQEVVFLGTRNSKTDGILLVNKGGSLFSVSVEENSLLSYIANSCRHIPDLSSLCFQIASSLPGADQMFVEQFNRQIIAGDYAGAAKTAASAPGTLLRNQDTINRFKSIQPPPGQKQPILLYFSSLLEKGRLNGIESVELCGPVLAQGRKNLVENWLKENKLECTDELGDLIKRYDAQLAVQVYQKNTSNPQKYIQGLMEAGQFDQVLQVSQQQGIRPDFISLLKNIISTDPERGLEAAKQLVSKDKSINVHQIAEIFLSFNRVKEFSAFLVDCMRDNRPEDGPWQTKVLELNLMMAPHIAETIFQIDIWNQYNKQKIAPLCEQKGLLQRALENYTDIRDIKRVILNTHILSPDLISSYLSKQEKDVCLQCMQELVRHNRQNMQIVVQTAAQNWDRLEPLNVIKVFESVGAFDGVYYFLSQILPSTQDPELYFKYIEASTKCNQLREAERVIRETTFYDPVRVKNFLKEIRLADPRPLIYLCDIHGFVDELTKYLYQNNFNKFIEIYLFKVNPAATPAVLGTLIDLECDENYIKQILYNIRSNCQPEALIEEFEKRNKTRVLENWLEDRAKEGNQTASIHNTLAKIYIDTSHPDTQDFLVNNQYYSSQDVGKYCEDRDPHLACTIYKRAWGQCDLELIEVTNKNALYRIQAKYLVERQDKELWVSVLSPDNPHRRHIIDQIVSHALPDSKSADEVASTVQAFMTANLPTELMSLLEKIVLHSTEFSGVKRLQNLLIITAIKADKTRVMEYINRLDNYDGPEIAKIALGEQYQLYEEAFTIYKKTNNHVEAVEVLLDNLDNIVRAAEYSEKVNLPEVWSKLAKAYLDKDLVQESIDSYIKANDANNYISVIHAAKTENKFEHLVKYLLMARKSFKDQVIDSEIAYAYAKLNKLADLEAFISNSNSADISRIGDLCYNDKLFEAAKILFVHTKNNAKIASCLVHLKQFQAAVESAKKANTPKTWKEVCMACVSNQEYKLAAVAGAYIIIHPDHLEELIHHYEKYNVPEEMIQLLESGMHMERAHIGIFTELGVMYAKYKPEKLMEHIRNYFQKLNVSKLLRVCERYLLWNEAVYLYTNYNEHDNAINIMIEHSPTAWNHDQFINIIQKVSNTDLQYKAILFYLEEQPQLINELLKGLTNKIDLSKAVSVLRKTGYLSLVTPWLKSVQSQNNASINEALNSVYLENEDHESLRESVTGFENFDQLALAQSTERHQIMEFRRISAYLYRKHQKYQKSIALSKQDRVYRDAIETAQESKDPELVEDLLRFFVEQKDKEYFTVALYTCYDLIRPDVVLELSWRFQLFENSIPYFVQILRELTHRVETVQKKHEDREKKEEKQAQQQLNQPLDLGDMGLMMPGLNQVQMLMPPPGVMPGINPIPGNGIMPGGFTGMGSQGLGGGVFPQMGGQGLGGGIFPQMGGGFNTNNYPGQF